MNCTTMTLPYFLSLLHIAKKYRFLQRRREAFKNFPSLRVHSTHVFEAYKKMFKHWSPCHCLTYQVSNTNITHISLLNIENILDWVL